MSSVELRICLTKLMIPMVFFSHFSDQNLVSIVKVTNIRTYSGEINKLPDIYTIGRGAMNISIKKWEIKYFKIKNHLIINCR